MANQRPAAGEEWNPGDETPARQAASVLVLRDGPDGPEVLLVQRNPEARFMGGAWVFPGGSVHDEDGGHAGAALRELEEEAALTLAGEDELVPYSRWITPTEVKIRFDTYFYLARAPEGAEPVCDGEECVALGWYRPSQALEESERGELSLVFPTVKNIEGLTEFATVEEALAEARTRDVVPVQPRVVASEGEVRVLMPGEPGYDRE